MALRTLLRKRTVTATGTGPSIRTDGVTTAVVLLDVTAAATEVGDTLDVYLQHSMDNGTTWDDFAHFTQVLGNGGAKKHIVFWDGRPTPETELRAPADGTLAVGVLQGITGSLWRVKYKITDAGTVNASFTIEVKADTR